VLLDTRSRGRRVALAGIVGGWIDGCARSGFDAVEPDNLDSWTRSRGVLHRADAIDFAVAEECRVYDECGAYAAAYGRRVIEIEYADQGLRFFVAACRLRGGRASIIDRELARPGAAGYVYGGC